MKIRIFVFVAGMLVVEVWPNSWIWCKTSTINVVNVLLLTSVSIFNVFYYLMLRKWSSFNEDEDPCFCFCYRHVGCWGMTQIVNFMQNINNQRFQHAFVDICFNFQCLNLLVLSKTIHVQFRWRSACLFWLQACWLLRYDQIREFYAKHQQSMFCCLDSSLLSLHPQLAHRKLHGCAYDSQGTYG